MIPKNWVNAGNLTLEVLDGVNPAAGDIAKVIQLDVE
jgi:hypothetical protein